MSRINKFLSVLLAILMVVSIIPITVSAAPDPYSGVCGDNLTWSFDETTGTLTIFGTGAMYDYPYDDSQWYDLKSEIVNVVIEDGVTSIGSSAFELFVNLKSITIPESVTVIGAYAFGECDSLTKIVLHEGVTKIGDGAFANCDYLDTVVIPGTVTEFGDDVFAHCDRLANVTLCEGLTDIGTGTFANCTSLTDIVIPESVTSLRGENFAGCVNLKSITFSVNVENVGYGTFGDCLNLQDVYYTGTEEDLLHFESMPYGKNEPLFAANFHCESTVHRHNYVKTGEYVAEFCDEDGYTTYTCECGHSYKGDYVKATGHSYDNGVVTTKPTCDVDGVKTFTCVACGGTYTEAVPQTGHSYDDGVITKDPTCTTDGVKTFTCTTCGDTYTEAVDKVEGHDYQLVVNTSPDTGCVKTYKCSVCGDTYKEAVGTTHTQVATPEFAPTETKPGLTVGISCSSCGAVLLEQKVIPALGTTEDSSVIVSGTCGTNATWTYNKQTGALIISGTGAMERYKSTQSKPWQNYEDDIKTIVINNGITKIDNYTFDSCSALMYVSIPDSVTAIGNYVFKNCNNLRSVTIPDGVTSIGDELFKNCKNLINVEIGNKVSQIGASAFNGCSSLTEITIPDSVYYIYDSAFENCANLKSVTIGKNVETIYNKAFSGCTALTDVYYTGTEEQWKNISIGTGNDPLLKATNRYDGAGGDILSGHSNHKNTITTIEPTCTEAGYTKFVCECGYEYTVNYDALGHSEEEIPPVLPTSSRVGYTRGKKCTTCETVLTEPVVVPIISETAIAGDAGYNVIWTYDEATQTMEFFGKGYIKYYDPEVRASNESDERPWAIYGLSSVQYVIVHEGIIGINPQNFYYFTGLKLISLPSSLEWIADDAFEGCENFYIKYDGTNEEWNKIDGNFANNGRIIFNDYSGVTASGTHGDNLTWTYDATTFTLTISGTGPMESVVYNEYPWYEYIPEIETIIIKEGVTTIGESAFYDCGFENITIPNTVTTIGQAAFLFCDNYKSITIPSSVTIIGNDAFYPYDVFRYKLEDVYYLGTEEMWNNISMGSLNILLDDNYATIHFVKYAGYCGHNLTYSFDGSTLTISGTGDMCEFDVDFGGYIYRPWEDWADEIKHIVIADGVTSISRLAFSYCNNLETVTFGSGITKIGEQAFYYCESLTDIILPDGLTLIDRYAFCDCTSLKTVVLPDSIEEIMYGAFCDCTSVTDVYYPGTESQWNEIIIDYKNEAISNARIHYNSKEIHDHTYEAVITAPTCTEQGYTTYTCACGDTYVDDFVHKTGHTDNDNDVYCDVCKEYIYTATDICGDNLTWTFNESTDTLTISGTGAMYDFQSNNTPWENYKLSIKKVVISDGVTSIGQCAFAHCKNLESITIGNDVTEIGLSAFYYCTGLITVVIGNSVETIGENAFLHCDSLSSIIIPDGVTTIGPGAFMNCESLETVTMGSGLNRVGYSAFYLCSKLKDVYYNGSEADWENITFVSGMDSSIYNATIHFAKLVGTCGDNLTWEYDEKTETLTIFGTGDMEDYQIDHITGGPTHPWLDIMDKVKYLVIADGVTSIGRCAFYDFIALESVSIANSVEIIGRSAFLDCESLKSIVIPEGVIEIQIDAFRNCTSLTNVTFPSSLLLIDAGAFDGCESLTSVIIPINVQEIGSGAFDNCPNLTDVYYEGTEEQLNEILPIISFHPTFSYATIHYNYGKPFTGIKDDYFYKDDVKQKAYQLIEFDGDFYYTSDGHKIARNTTLYLNAEQVAGFKYADGTPLVAGYYNFDTDGKMVIMNGPVGEYFYKNNARVRAYNLVEFEGNFYYTSDGHKLAKDKRIYLNAEQVAGFTYADGTPLVAGYYNFDADGKMVIMNGPVGEYFYKNNARVRAYNLVEFEGNFYYTSDGHKLAKDKRLYLNAEQVAGFTYADGTPLSVGYYTFDADGKMVMLNGVVGDYFYENNVRVKAYNLVEFEGNFYYTSDGHKIARNTTLYLNAEQVAGFTYADGTPLVVGYYTFDADGKMVL